MLFRSPSKTELGRNKKNMKRLITSTIIEIVIKNLPANKSIGPNGFTGEFYRMLREELTPILLKLSQNIAEGGTLPQSFNRAPSP